MINHTKIKEHLKYITSLDYEKCNVVKTLGNFINEYKCHQNTPDYMTEFGITQYPSFCAMDISVFVFYDYAIHCVYHYVPDIYWPVVYVSCHYISDILALSRIFFQMYICCKITPSEIMPSRFFRLEISESKLYWPESDQFNQICSSFSTLCHTSTIYHISGLVKMTRF